MDKSCNHGRSTEICPDCISVRRLAPMLKDALRWTNKGFPVVSVWQNSAFENCVCQNDENNPFVDKPVKQMNVKSKLSDSEKIHLEHLFEFVLRSGLIYFPKHPLERESSEEGPGPANCAYCKKMVFLDNGSLRC